MSERQRSVSEEHDLDARASARQKQTETPRVKTKLIHFIRHRQMITNKYTEEMPPTRQALVYYDSEGYQSIYLPEHVPAESSYLQVSAKCPLLHRTYADHCHSLRYLMQPPPAPNYEKLEFEDAGIPPANKPYDPSLEAAIHDLEKTKPSATRDATLEFLSHELVLRKPKPARSLPVQEDPLRSSREAREKMLQSVLRDRRGVALDEESGWMDFGDLQPNPAMVLKAAAYFERGVSPNQFPTKPHRLSEGSAVDFVWPSVRVKKEFFVTFRY